MSDMDSFKLNKFDERMTKRSSSQISNFVALNATLAASIQVSTSNLPGSVTRYHDLGSMKMEHALSHAVALNRPVMDIATRGIMAQKGFIELDEVDLGWIVAEAAKELQIWQNKKKCYIGVLSLISPIAAAAGYLFSENANDLEYQLDFGDLKRLTIDFLENTTPEDTVHIFTRLYNAESDNFQKIKNYSSTLSDGQEMILADEINLVDFYKMFNKEILAFKEISTNFEFVFGEGKNTFFGTLDEGLSYTDSITNTYIHMIANDFDPHFLKLNKKLAYEFKKDAKMALDNGGINSKEGREITLEMERKFLEQDSITPLRGISDVTTAVTFLATLSGLRP